jgi:hypothetical protein
MKKATAVVHNSAPSAKVRATQPVADDVKVRFSWHDVKQAWNAFSKAEKKGT